MSSTILARRKGKFPDKGTKRRQILLLMLRTQGVSATEAMNLGLITARKSLGTILARFTDECGFDMIRWQLAHPGGWSKGRSQVAHRIIGRWRSDGKYVDYLTKTIKSEKPHGV